MDMQTIINQTQEFTVTETLAQYIFFRRIMNNEKCYSFIPPSIEPENIPLKWFGFFAMHDTASICPSIAPTKGLANI